MQLIVKKVGRVKHAGAAPWVTMIRSGLEAQGFFFFLLCFGAVEHLLNISAAAARTVQPSPFYFLLSGTNLNKVQGCLVEKNRKKVCDMCFCC